LEFLTSPFSSKRREKVSENWNSLKSSIRQLPDARRITLADKIFQILAGKVVGSK